MLYNPEESHLFYTLINGVYYRDSTIYTDREYQMITDLYYRELPLNLQACRMKRSMSDIPQFLLDAPTITIPVFELIRGWRTDVAKGLKIYQQGRARSGSRIWRRYDNFVLAHSEYSRFGRLAYLDGKENHLLSKYDVFPLSLKDANEYINMHHRHNSGVQGHKFSIGVKSVEDKIVGVMVVGLPISRHQNDNYTLEIRRTCCDPLYYNVNSVLMGRAAVIAQAEGYKRLITYTLPSEGGASLAAANFQQDGVVPGGKGYSWSSKSRNRTRPDKYPTGDKIRWTMDLTA